MLGRMPQDAAPEPDHWFEPIADHLGAAYLRYSFTMGTAQEVSTSWARSGSSRACGCSTSAADRGATPTSWPGGGSPATASTSPSASWPWPASTRPTGRPSSDCDARALAFDADFDAVVSLCQGGFGLVLGAGEDLTVLEGMVRAVRPGGRLAMTAFNAYFQVRHHTEATWDADAGVAHERTEVRDEQGVAAEVDLWTACYTPRELRLLARLAGLRVDAISAVEPGAYGDAPPDAEHAELLVLATRP